MIERLIEFCHRQEHIYVEKIAIIYMVIATLFHCLSQAVFKHAKIPIFQALYERSFLSVLLLHTMHPNDDYYPVNKTQDLIISQVLLAVGTGLIYQSLNYIPMAETTVIFQTNTIWSQFIIHLINKESITKSRLFNTIVCFIGILFIVNPTFDNADSLEHTLGCLFAFTTSILQVFCYIYIKKVGSSIKPTLFTFYFHLCMIIMCSLGQFYNPNYIFEMKTLYNIITMVTLSLIGHLLQFRSLSLVSYSKIAIYTYTSILFTMIIDFLVFDKITNIFGMIGGTAIVICLIKQLYEDKEEQDKKQQQQVQK